MKDEDEDEMSDVVFNKEENIECSKLFSSSSSSSLFIPGISGPI